MSVLPLGNVSHAFIISMTLTFGLNKKSYISSWICVWARSSLLFDIGIPNLARGCIIMRKLVVTFMTSVWPWILLFRLTLANIWVVGLSLVSFTHIFLILLLSSWVIVFFILEYWLSRVSCVGTTAILTWLFQRFLRQM